MKNIYLSIISGLLFTACSLDRTPHDALSTVTFPKTEADVEMLAVGCYDGYANQDYTVYNDVFSDNGYCAINTNWAVFANGAGGGVCVFVHPLGRPERAGFSLVRRELLHHGAANL